MGVACMAPVSMRVPDGGDNRPKCPNRMRRRTSHLPGPDPDDVVAVSDLCSTALEALMGRDWTVPAANVDWTCRQTLEHMCALAYGPQLAVRASTFRPLALIVAPN